MRKDNEIVISESGHRISPSGKFRIEAVHTEGPCCAVVFCRVRLFYTRFSKIYRQQTTAIYILLC